MPSGSPPPDELEATAGTAGEGAAGAVDAELVTVLAATAPDEAGVVAETTGDVLVVPVLVPAPLLFVARDIAPLLASTAAGLVVVCDEPWNGDESEPIEKLDIADSWSSQLMTQRQQVISAVKSWWRKLRASVSTLPGERNISFTSGGRCRR